MAIEFEVNQRYFSWATDQYKQCHCLDFPHHQGGDVEGDTSDHLLHTLDFDHAGFSISLSLICYYLKPNC